MFYTWSKKNFNKENVKENPLDCLDYEDMFDRNNNENEFYEVEKTGKEFKLGARISVCNLFKMGVDFLIKKTTSKTTNKTSGDSAKIGSSGDSAQIGSSGDWAQIGSSGYSAQIGSSGNSAKIGSSGYSAKIGSSGNSAKIGSSGDSAQIGSSGDWAQIGSSGDWAQIGSSGYSAQIGSSGNSAKIGSSGDSAQIGSSGDWAQIGSSGYSAQIGSSGNSAKIGSSGYSAKIGSSGNSAKIGSSGDSAKIEITGENSICFACGYESRIKANKGTWISLAEYQQFDGKIIPIFAKSAQIGNPDYVDCFDEVLSENYFYELVNKKFIPELIIDNSVMVIKSAKKLGEFTVYKTVYLEDFKKNIHTAQYVAKRGSVYAHGETIKSAIADVEFKYLQSQDIQEHIKRIKKQGYMTAMDYRLITGACQYGTNKWLTENGFTWEDKKSVEEVAELVKGEYGSERFAEFVKLFKEKG